MKKDQIKEKYLSSATSYKLLEKKQERLLIILSVLRFFTFIGGLILIWIGFTKKIPAGIILSLIITVLFLLLFKIFSNYSEKKELLGKLFSNYSEKKEFLGNLVLINKNETGALSGNLSAFDAGNSYTDIKHDFSFDVDLFGASSLFQYLNRTVTGYGREILADWLSDPFILSKELGPRQEAIKELASKDRWRQEFMASGMKTPLEKKEISGLLEWIEERAVINSSPFKKFLIISLPAAAIVSLSLMITGILPYPVFVCTFLINLFYIATGLIRINKIHNALSKKYNFPTSMNRLLKAFENDPFTSHVLDDIKANISGKGVSAAVSVRKLGRLIQAFDTRNNQLAGAILNGLLLWDYQSISRLEKWKSEYRTLFPGWLEMIGKVDAYISLGNYSFNNPDFVYPIVSD